MVCSGNTLVFTVCIRQLNSNYYKGIWTSRKADPETLLFFLPVRQVTCFELSQN